jgi:tetratricopeptide (TPR) repeat protein
MRTHPTRHWALGAALLLTITGLQSKAAEPADDAQLYQESYAFEALGDFESALDAMHRVTGKRRETYFHHLRLGWLHYSAGAFDASMNAYRAAISLEPGAVEPYLGLLLPQLARRSWKDAEKTARLALERDPMNAPASARLAWALYNQGRFPEAEVVYRKVLASYPADLEMRAGLAWSLLEQGKHAPAEAEFRRILEVAPEHPGARSGLAKLAEAIGR